MDIQNKVNEMNNKVIEINNKVIEINNKVTEINEVKMEKKQIKIIKRESQLTVIVDKREQVDLNLLMDKKGLNVVYDILEVGDFLFKYGETELILIERKTISDLLSSIKADGRYKEQKLRLKACKQQKTGLRIFYLIEGLYQTIPTNKYFSEIDRKIIHGAYLGTMIRDDIPVIITANFNDTVKLLIKITDLILENLDAFMPLQLKEQAAVTPTITPNTVEIDKYSIAVKIKKNENMDEKWCYLAQLQQIPGVSESVAVRIAELYKDLPTLIDAYRMSENPENMLSELDMPDRKLTKTGNTRTIGTVLSNKIWKWLGSPRKK